MLSPTLPIRLCTCTNKQTWNGAHAQVVHVDQQYYYYEMYYYDAILDRY